MTMWPSIALLAFVTLQRLVELPVARANTRRLIAGGAYEVAPGHYPLIVAVHAAWLATLWWLAPTRPLDPIFFLAFVFFCEPSHAEFLESRTAGDGLGHCFG